MSTACDCSTPREISSEYFEGHMSDCPEQVRITQRELCEIADHLESVGHARGMYFDDGGDESKPFVECPACLLGAFQLVRIGDDGIIPVVNINVIAWFNALHRNGDLTARALVSLHDYSEAQDPFGTVIALSDNSPTGELVERLREWAPS